MSKPFTRFDCPVCKRRLKIPRSGLRKRIFCPRCNSILESSKSKSKTLIVASSKQTDLFGPPVHRDFIRAELCEVGADGFSTLSGIDPQESQNSLPLTAVTGTVEPNEALEEYSKAKIWARNHSEVQSNFDDYLVQFAVGGLVLGVGMLLVPWVRTILLQATPLDFDFPLLGLLFSTPAILLLAIANRRKPKRILTHIVSLGLPIAALVVFMPPPIEAPEEIEAVAYLPESLPTADGGRMDKFIGNSEKSPTANFVPLNDGSNRLERNSNANEVKRSKPGRSGIVDISPVGDGRVKEFDANNTPVIEKREFTPTRVLGKIQIQRRTPERLRQDFVDAWEKWKLGPAFDSKKKITKLEKRKKLFRNTSVNKRVIQDEKILRDYAVTEAAGKATVFGNAFYRTLPIHGIDVGSVGQRIEKFVPLTGGPEFDDSLAWDANFFLVGLNVHVKSVVVGVQGVFAPVVKGELNMDSKVTGPWYGQPAENPKFLKSTTSYGNPVYGVVVYKNKFDIVGLSLVVGL